MKEIEYIAIRKVCDKWYPKKKKEHCGAVEELVTYDPMYLTLSDEQQYLVRALAYAHDVIEDTKCSMDELVACIESKIDQLDFVADLTLLTHIKGKKYYDYVQAIVESKRCFAVMVKRADMIDHLKRKATLTDKLKKKYLPVIPMLFYPQDVIK